jgi:hypothetical protein
MALHVRERMKSRVAFKIRRTPAELFSARLGEAIRG